MTRLLLIHQEPIERQFIADQLREKSGADVEVTSTATEGTSIIAGTHFDLALVGTDSLHMPAIRLMAAAVDQNTPLLWLSNTSSTSMALRNLGCVYLERPLNLEELVSESQRMIRAARDLRSQITDSVSRLEFQINALKAEIAESHRLFDQIMVRLGYEKTRPTHRAL